jgi:hypothetical protein
MISHTIGCPKDFTNLVGLELPLAIDHDHPGAPLESEIMHPHRGGEGDERHLNPLGKALHDPSHLVLEHGELGGRSGRVDHEHDRGRSRPPGSVRWQSVLDAGVRGEELGGERVGREVARETVGPGAAEGAGPARGGVVHPRERVERGAAGRRAAAERRVGEHRDGVGARRRRVERRAEDGGGHDERRGGGGRRRPRVPRPPEALHRLQLREVHRNRASIGAATRVGLLLPPSNVLPCSFFSFPFGGFLSSSGAFAGCIFSSA